MTSDLKDYILIKFDMVCVNVLCSGRETSRVAKESGTITECQRTAARIP